MLGLQIFVFSIQNILIAQAASMMITTLSQTGTVRNQKYNFQSIYKNDNFESDKNMKNDVSPKNVMKREAKKHYFERTDECQCKPFLLKKPQYLATHQNQDLKIMKKTSNFNMLPKGYSCKNHTNNSLRCIAEVHNSSDGVFNLITRDLDNFYDSELIRKLSDNNGQLPTDLKLIISADKDPIVIYNESDANLKNIGKKLVKREAKPTKTNVYYDYNYYDDQSLDNSQLNSGEYSIKKKISPSRKVINHSRKNSNNLVCDTDKGITNIHSRSALTKPKVIESTLIPEEYLSADSSTALQEEKGEDIKSNGSLNIKNAISLMKDTFNNKINAAVKRKGTCPPSDSGSGQGCHPGGGLPKNPGMPPLSKGVKDPYYEKLLKGEISESVVKAIVDKVHKNSKMATELGICDFDMGELRTLYKQIRTKERKECCLKLRGEFKCFLNWLLTVEPSRKKRSDISQNKKNGCSSCNQFPKFSIMGSRDLYPPSRQYEKLVQKLEEYRDEDNV